jgi:hypothetical protein
LSVVISRVLTNRRDSGLLSHLLLYPG